MYVLIFTLKSFANPVKAYFQKSSPPFTNSRGQVIDASKQVDAFAQAQSIVYLSIFICQAFNVGKLYLVLVFTNVLTAGTGVCCESPSFFPLRQKCYCKQVQFCWYLCWSLSRDVYYLYPASSSCVRRIVPLVAPLLAYSFRFWYRHTSLGFLEGDLTQEIDRALEGQRYQRTYDV